VEDDVPTEKSANPAPRVDVDSPQEIAKLAEELGVSPYHLRKVIIRTGPLLKDILHGLGFRDWEVPRLLHREI
jgi:hypothetical protein